MHGVEFNDRLLSLAAQGTLLAAAGPRVAARAGGLRQSLPAQVDLLRERWPATATEPVWAAVSPLFEAADLGELLRLLRAAGYRVQGFADVACAVVAWLQVPGQSLVLDLGASGRAISQVASSGGAAGLQRTVRLAEGLNALLDQWLRLVAATLVDQWRFDALHDQQHELQLRERLHHLIVAVQRDGSGTVILELADRELAVTLSRDQLVAAAQGWYQSLSAALQALCAGIGDCSVLVPESLLAYPGMSEALATAHAGSVLAVPDGLAARAVSLMPVAGQEPAGPVQYLTRIAAIGPPAPPDASRPVALDARALRTMATHVVFRGRAIGIPAAGLLLGRDPPPAAEVLRLPEGIAGLSRCHCTLRRGPSGTQIIDHSQFGSFVDGLRVNGRGFLAAGSTLRLGSPGIELPLIALDAAPAAVAG
jgi:hypothetical protein